MSEPTASTFLSITGEPLEQLTWMPEQTPKAIVQLVHGMAEHLERYDATAKTLNAAGFLVVGHTQLGHSASAKTLGWFANQDGWNALVEDVHALREKTQKEYPGLPYFLLGHSMGSFIVRTYCLKHEAGLAGVILSGTGHFEPPILNVALCIANLQCAFGGEKKPSVLLSNMSFAGYNRDWTPTRTAFDWLSKDTDIVDRYAADPLCGYPFTAGGYRDMFRGLKRLYPKHLASMDKSVPVRLFSGAADPVGNRGAGVKTTMQELLAAGVTDVTMKLYEGGRHEMLNETERELVWNDLIAWLEEHMPR
ncbi:MAG TPA: lysophospholipase [Candidatus Limiplasma sp.]|nr:lysophospholipase [Candidatus Limiplasma sp.]